MEKSLELDEREVFKSYQEEVPGSHPGAPSKKKNFKKVHKKQGEYFHGKQ